MAQNFHQPIRMCISCRERAVQSNLFRLRCVDGELSSFDGIGRSFYLCFSCLDDGKKLSKALMRQCRTNKREQLMNKLKEIITDDR
ncbi:DUF448 domain-containing protein [Sulfurimonas sp. SAG-AH-194-L11]|nr:DUF448 domain-containing protein [Sulfurimonas sp. SAG-AH-194-L11]